MRKKLILNYSIRILLMFFFSGSSVFAQNSREEDFNEIVVMQSDSVVKPFVRSVAIGTNLASPVMKALGQDHGDFEVMAEANLINRFFPEISFGVGNGNIFADNGIQVDVPYAMF